MADEAARAEGEQGLSRMQYEAQIPEAEEPEPDSMADVLSRLERVVEAAAPWPEFMSRATAAEFLDVSEETIRRWTKKGLPVCVFPSTDSGSRGVLRYPRRAILKWAARWRRRSKP